MLVWITFGVVLILPFCFWFAYSEVLIPLQREGFLMPKDTFFSAHVIFKEMLPKKYVLSHRDTSRGSKGKQAGLQHFPSESRAVIPQRG